MLAVEVVELISLLTCCVHKSCDLKRETRTTRENRETHDPNPRKPTGTGFRGLGSGLAWDTPGLPVLFPSPTQPRKEP